MFALPTTCQPTESINVSICLSIIYLSIYHFIIYNRMPAFQELLGGVPWPIVLQLQSHLSQLTLKSGTYSDLESTHLWGTSFCFRRFKQVDFPTLFASRAALLSVVTMNPEVTFHNILNWLE
jgi:hypothetical protein